MKTDLGYGDQLISVTHTFSNPAAPTGMDETTYFAGKHGVRQISVGRLSGMHADILTAQITFEDHRPDLIVPLCTTARFEVQYGD